MTIFRVLLLDCATCDARFVPPRPVGESELLRRLARAAGWVTNWRDKGADYCPKCGPECGVGYSKARGICTVCNKERSITSRDVIQKHPAAEHPPTGGFAWCAGGGLAARQITHHTSPRNREWQGLL